MVMGRDGLGYQGRHAYMYSESLPVATGAAEDQCLQALTSGGVHGHMGQGAESTEALGVGLVRCGPREASRLTPAG